MIGSSGLQRPWFVALDVDSRERALALAREVAPWVGGFKVGPRLILRCGSALIRELASLGPVFVDQKYHDIPNTMEHAIRATFEAGASFCTIHAGIGAAALKHMAKVERELAAQRPFQILAVTVLTSLAADALPAHWRKAPIAQLVDDLASEVLASGLSGLVCSAEEVERLRTRHPAAFLLTPGIRLPGQDRGDQARVMSPKEALEAGSSALVVGRPVVEASDPAAAAREIQSWVEKARVYG